MGASFEWQAKCGSVGELDETQEARPSETLVFERAVHSAHISEVDSGQGVRRYRSFDERTESAVISVIASV